MKKYWDNTWQYRRIMEVLDDYWLTCEDEKKVVIDMYFENDRGETQTKHITWTRGKHTEDSI